MKLQRSIMLKEVQTGTDVPSRFIYEISRPLQVTLSLGWSDQEVVEWIFARDLLRDGLKGDAGLGDVRVFCHGNKLHICLQSEEGYYQLMGPMYRIKAFISTMYSMVCEENEEKHLETLLDGAINGLLGRA